MIQRHCDRHFLGGQITMKTLLIHFIPGLLFIAAVSVLLSGEFVISSALFAGAAVVSHVLRTG